MHLSRQHTWTRPRPFFSVKHGGLVAGVSFGLVPTHMAYSNAPDPSTPPHICRLTSRRRFATERELLPTLVDRNQHRKRCSINSTKRDRRAADRSHTTPRSTRDPRVASRPPKTHVQIRVCSRLFPFFVQAVEIVLDHAVRICYGEEHQA